MKARIPKNLNKENNNSDTIISYVPTTPVTFSELLQIIEADFNKLYKKHGKENLLGITKALMAKQYLNQIGVPKHSLKQAKAKVLAILEAKVSEIATNQYIEKTEKENSLPLNVLHSMFQPHYTQPIQESHYSDEIKQAAQRGVKKAIYAQAEKFGMSKEEFDLFAQDPKEFIKRKKEISETEKQTTTSEVPQTEPAEKTFFDRVKGYTNNFTSFLIPATEEISIKPTEKFENYEQYLKFTTFKNKLKAYSTEHNLSELQVIEKILSKKSKEFSEVDEDFTRILTERKKVILEQEKDDQEK